MGNIVFVGSKSYRFGGAVYAIDATTYNLIPGKFYSAKNLEHPTGITSYRNLLIVGEQSKNVIHAFDIETCKHLGKLVSDIPGRVEQLLLSDI